MAKKTTAKTPATTVDASAKTHARTAVAPAPDLFGGASKAVPVFKVKKTSGKERDVEDLGPDLDRLAAFSVMIDALEGAAKQLQAEMRERCYGLYAEKAVALKAHPASFIGEGEVATASIEMRRRGSNMPITDDEVLDELREKGISLQEIVRVPERFVFNNELLQSEDVRAAISEAFAAHPVLKPIAEQLIQHQEKEFSYCTTEMSLGEAAAKLSKEDYERLVPMLSTLGVGKFHLQGEAIKMGKGDEKTVTPKAKALAIGMLQEMGILPAAEKPVHKRNAK